VREPRLPYGGTHSIAKGSVGSPGGAGRPSLRGAHIPGKPVGIVVLDGRLFPSED
jgi:hypothetical protein